VNRKRKNLNYIRVKNLIKKELYHINRYDIEGNWVDIYFLSLKKHNYYNCSITTVDFKTIEIVNDKVFDELISKYNWKEIKQEYFEEKQKELLDSNLIKVKEEIIIDNSYRYGIGLEVILDVKKINKDIIKQFINVFRFNGEVV
jgi:hypothetical protein